MLTSVAQFCKGEGGVKAFREKLQPFRDTLQGFQFLGGTSPCYADMYLLAAFMVRIPRDIFNSPVSGLLTSLQSWQFFTQY